MTNGHLVCKNITHGNASRFIRQRWITNDKLSTEAFDLRDGNPPETYVSHIMAEGDLLNDQFISAYSGISKRIKDCLRGKGSIAILNVSEALAEVNDEAEPFIEFIEQGLPHCGLFYLTVNQQQIQETKATLCILARKRLRDSQSIQNLITLTTEGA